MTRDPGRREQVKLASRCPFCASSEATELYGIGTNQGERYRFDRCRGCHAVYLSPTPDPDRLARAYSADYYGRGSSKFLPLIENVVRWYRRLRARRVCRVVPKGGRVLDLGCGNGEFLRGLAEQGIEAHGLEIPGRAAERAQEIAGIEVFEGTLSEAPYRERSFDAVTLWHVLEHLADPRATLETLARLLTPAGYLFLSLPNIDSWQSRIFRGHWLHHDPPRHLCYLGRHQLEQQLGRLGFRLIRHSFFSIEQNPFGFQQSLLNSWLPKRDVLYEFLKGNRAVVEEHGRWAIGLQLFFFVATFPLFAALSMVESALGHGGTMELVFQKQDSERQDTEKRGPEKKGPESQGLSEIEGPLL